MITKLTGYKNLPISLKFIFLFPLKIISSLNLFCRNSDLDYKALNQGLCLIPIRYI